MFAPVPSKPDLVAEEHALLAFWRDRRIFARLREQVAGGTRWSFLDGPITANNPMGVHHAWGRTYKDVFQRYHAMLGHDQRWQNGFDCQGLWVEVNVERDLGFTSKRDIEDYGIAEFVSLCKQRVLTYAARQTEQSIRLGYWMDWDDPEELRRLRDLLAAEPDASVTVEGPRGPVTDTVEMIVGRLGMPEVGGSYYTFSNENNDLIWAFLAECHRRGWLYKGHDTMPWCARCGTGISQHEMTEGYQDREDPGLTIRFPLIDRPGEALLVWTTTPWTLTSNVVAAVGAELAYVKVRQGDRVYWLGKGTLRQALQGPFEVLDELPGSALEGWRYRGPFDDLHAVRAAFATSGRAGGAFEHHIVLWDEVGEEEGTGIVHVAPGCGAEDFALGKQLGLPMIAPLDENGIFIEGFDALTGRDVRDTTDQILERLRHHGFFYRLEPYRHRYPHCWRCGTPLVFRLVDEWYISMGPVYDRPRSELTADEVDASLRYQIMEVVDGIRWIPSFGYERELDWLLNMHDWMISKKRYWGLALPIYDCRACGTVEVVGGREELRERAVEGWEVLEGHTPHRPYVDAVKIACPGCGAPVERVRDVGNPWLDAGIVPFSTMHYRTDPAYWETWFPADFITESFPGQFRNWFYSLLAMSTVLRREAPFRTIFGYATLFGEDGRPMHKSWGNAIEFDEAAERMGVDVMRWTYANARPEDNILFGWHAADEARRELLVLWNVYAFFVTYARVAGWTPDRPAPALDDRTGLDRWILSRLAGLADRVGDRLADYDLDAGAREISRFIDDLSTWYLRLSRKRFSRSSDAADRDAAFATLHTSLVGLARVLAPILPFLSESLYRNLVVAVDAAAPESIHLTSWPAPELSSFRDPGLEDAMAVFSRAVELIRSLRSQAGIKLRQPLARAWITLTDAGVGYSDDMLGRLADEINVKEIVVIASDSDLVERRVKPLLPRIGRRLGAAIPAVMAAARDGTAEIHADGSVTLAGVTLAPDEVEILSSPRPGTAVAHDEGLVVVLDTTVTPELRAEGEARDLQRAIQDLRREMGLAVDERIDLAVEEGPAVERISPFLAGIGAETLADAVAVGPVPADAAFGEVAVESGTLRFGIRRRDGAAS
ncbi:MAG: class I tRNA ligase family protein [Chloroflexi bacterium]|nr:class I tRNA ligase family protein [Chloroflexota bacterium]